MCGRALFPSVDPVGFPRLRCAVNYSLPKSKKGSARGWPFRLRIPLAGSRPALLDGALPSGDKESVMALVFHGASGSPYAWRVWLALEHKRIPYELRTLSFDKGDLKAAEFRALNPRGRVPV